MTKKILALVFLYAGVLHAESPVIPQTSILDLWDFNGDGVAEIGHFGIRTDDGHAPQVQVTDLKTGQIVTTFTWPSDLTQPRVVVLKDRNGDGVSELGLFGHNKLDNRPQLIIKDGANFAAKNSKISWPALLRDVDLWELQDLDGDGVSELAITGINTSNDRPTIIRRDSASKSAPIVYTWPAQWLNVSFIQMPDLNNDGYNDVAIAGIKSSKFSNQLIVKNIINPKETLSVFNWADNWLQSHIIPFPDVNDDGIDDVALWGVRKDNKRPQLIVKNSLNKKQTLLNIGWPNSINAKDLEIVSDRDGDGVKDVALFATRQRDNASQFIIKSTKTKKTIDAYGWADSWWNTSIHELPDINHDGKTEIALLGGSKVAGLAQLLVIDSASGEKLKPFGWPSHAAALSSFHILPDTNNDGVADIGLYTAESSSGDLQIKNTTLPNQNLSQVRWSNEWYSVADFDGDGFNDWVDNDDDGDGVLDDVDANPYSPFESYDADQDGLADAVDPDDDNDGVPDKDDFFPLDKDRSQEPYFSETPDVVIDNPEGKLNLDWCPWGYRRDVQVYDFNIDLIPDLLVNMSCVDWENPGTTVVHDEDYRSAFTVWLGDGSGGFNNATKDIIGMDYIDVSDQQTGGGVAGTGEIRKQDLNFDGYPDFYYHMNRDDAARAADFQNVYHPEPHYTWRSQQSTLMSNGDGTYSVKFWGTPFYVQLVDVLPNAENSFDIIGLGYGDSQVARLVNDEWVDVESEWEQTPAWFTLQSSGVYWSFINLDEKYDPMQAASPLPQYLVVDGVTEEYASRQENGLMPSGSTFFSVNNGSISYLDTWQHDQPHIIYKERCDVCEGGVNNASGFDWNGEMTFGMAWETQHVVKLYKDEPAVIILEALGFALPHKYKNDPLEPDEIYESGSPNQPLDPARLYLPAHLLKVLRIEDGKVVDRDPNPITTNIIRDGSFRYYFDDIDDDGYDDMIIQTHSSLTPAVYLNNQQGQFIRLKDTIFPESVLGTVINPDYPEQELWLGGAGALRDVNNDGLLDLVVWHNGRQPTTYDNWSEERKNAIKYQFGQIQIYYAKRKLSIQESGMTDEEVIAREIEKGF